MAVEQVSSRTVQAISGTAVTDATSLLREGAVLEGRVLAINPDETLRLATRLGQLDVDPSAVMVAGGHGGRGRPALLQSLIGTTVKLEVATQGSAGNRLIVRLIGGDENTALAATQSIETTDVTAGEVSVRLATEMSHAAARQDGLAPVFASAQELTAFGDTLPETLANALANLSGFAVSAQDLVSPEAVRSAFLRSGLFFEAKLALLSQGAGDVVGLDINHSLAGQDLKAALLSLKPAIDAWLAGQQGGEPVPDAGTGATRPSPMASANAALNEATLAGVADAPVDTEALFAVLRPPPVANAAGPDQGNALFSLALQQQSFSGTTPSPNHTDAGTLAVLGNLMEASGLAAPSLSRRGPYGGRPITASAATRVRMGEDSPLATSGRPPPPRRGSAPLGQAALSPAGTGSRDPLIVARALSDHVSNAIARISLGQYASLPPDAHALGHAAGQAHPDAGAWLFEIPIAAAQGVSIAQFEIDQVHDHPSGAEATGPVWRVQFALNAHDLGPIHARLVLGGNRLSVGLWAEAATGIATVSALLPTLRRGLETAGLVVAEIHFAPGRPPSGPPVRAGGFIDRNA